MPGLHRFASRPRRPYLDYNTTTPLAPEAAAEMRELLESDIGNQSSSHRAETAATEPVERSRAERAEVAGLLRARRTTRSPSRD